MKHEFLAGFRLEIFASILGIGISDFVLTAHTSVAGTYLDPYKNKNREPHARVQQIEDFELRERDAACGGRHSNCTKRRLLLDDLLLEDTLVLI
jgi:hypothetical protein